MDRLPDRATGPRLTIRRYEEADAEVLAATIGDNLDHLRPYMRWISHEPLTLEQRRDLIATWDDEWRDGGDLVLGAFDGDALVAGTGLHRRIGPNALEIGYWVARDRLRHGYATEVSRVLIDVAFGIPGVERVEIHHDITNVASEGVPRRLGFEDVGELRSQRDELAPAECGTDRAWRLTRDRWEMMRS